MKSYLNKLNSLALDDYKCDHCGVRYSEKRKKCFYCGKSDTIHLKKIKSLPKEKSKIFGATLQINFK